MIYYLILYLLGLFGNPKDEVDNLTLLHSLKVLFEDSVCYEITILPNVKSDDDYVL